MLFGLLFNFLSNNEGTGKRFTLKVVPCFFYFIYIMNEKIPGIILQNRDPIIMKGVFIYGICKIAYWEND